MTTSWTFGGTNLATAFGKVTLIDDYLDTVNRRGDNVKIPLRHGSVYVPKYFDQRTIVLGLTIVGSSATDLETKFDTLKALLAPKTRQTLSNTREDASVRTVSASVDSMYNVTRLSDKIARITIEFVLNNPFFRGASLIADNETVIDASPKAMIVANTGTVEETNPIITLTGPLSNTILTNAANGCILTYTGTIASPRIVTISTDATTGEFLCTDDLSANLISNVTHSGAPSLMVIEVGNNTFAVNDDTATTGTAKISFYPPYL